MTGGKENLSPTTSPEITGEEPESIVEDLVETVSADTFEAWYREREYARNIREGTAYFNGPPATKPPQRLSPSSLLQCQRKTTYRQLNAPEESADPEGIFWVGSQFETEIAVPYLRDFVVTEGEYVTNSLWVDFEVETDVGNLRIKGETDPVVVDSDAEPLLLTEIKTKRSVESMESPSKHHKAQAHAYLKGLSQKYDRNVTDSVILYGSRKSLDVAAFHVEFDPVFWSDVVVRWAAEHSRYRQEEILPPAEPEQSWECDFCAFSERCGKGSSGYTDAPVEGLLPGLEDYPREKIEAYLEATSGARLTPTLAREYPQLAIEYEVASWRCPHCGSKFPWDGVEVESETPACPDCADAGRLTELVVENPVESRRLDSGETQLATRRDSYE